MSFSPSSASLISRTAFFHRAHIRAFTVDYMIHSFIICKTDVFIIKICNCILACYPRIGFRHIIFSRSIAAFPITRSADDAPPRNSESQSIFFDSFHYSASDLFRFNTCILQQKCRFFNLMANIRHIFLEIQFSLCYHRFID